MFQTSNLLISYEVTEEEENQRLSYTGIKHRIKFVQQNDALVYMKCN